MQISIIRSVIKVFVARAGWILVAFFFCGLLPFSAAAQDAVTGHDYEADVRKIYKDTPDYDKQWPIEFAVRIDEGVTFDLGKALSNLGTPYYDEFSLLDRPVLLQGLTKPGPGQSTDRSPTETMVSVGPDLFTPVSELGWGSPGAVTVLPGGVQRSVWTPTPAGKLDTDAVHEFWKKYINSYRFLDRIFFKVKKGTIPSPGIFDSLVAFDFAGREAGDAGPWRHDYGRANIVLTKTSVGWRISRFAITEMTSERRGSKMFENVTRPMISQLSEFQQYVLTSRSMDDELFLATFKRLLPAGGLADTHGRASVVDIDQDGWDDLFVWDEVGESVLLHNVAMPSGQRGFENATDKFGLSLRNAASVVFADLNNDGTLDVVVGRWNAPSEILLGFRYGDDKDQLVFLSSKANVESILPSAVISIATADVNNDGYLDLFFATADQKYHYDKNSTRNGTFDRIGPPNVLLINYGDGTFGDLSKRYGLDEERPTLAAAFEDYNKDGYPDLALANDFGVMQLYLNENGDHFRDVTKEAGVSNVYFGMGLSWGDYDNDGDMDLYVTAMQSTAGTRVTSDEKNITATDLKQDLVLSPRGNILFRNNGDGTFTDTSAEAPFAIVRNANWAYGAQFADFDNDSFLDIYSPNGFFTFPRLGNRTVVRDF